MVNMLCTIYGNSSLILMLLFFKCLRNKPAIFFFIVVSLSFNFKIFLFPSFMLYWESEDKRKGIYSLFFQMYNRHQKSFHASFLTATLSSDQPPGWYPGGFLCQNYYCFPHLLSTGFSSPVFKSLRIFGFPAIFFSDIRLTTSMHSWVFLITSHSSGLSP